MKRMLLSLIQLGRVDYSTALDLQQSLVDLRKQDRISDTLLLLEHDPVLTLGRNSSRSNILVNDEQLAARNVTVFETKRGGDVTYHGPGQLVGYPIIDLRGIFAAQPGSASLGARHDAADPESIRVRLSAVEYVRRLEEAIIRTCAEYRVPTQRICGRTGVWTLPAPATSSTPTQPERKIAAIGVHISGGITSHGFAFNLTTDLDDFSLIVPCGIADREVTSLARELGGRPMPSWDDVSASIARNLGWALGRQIMALDSLDALLAHA
jgi:lipoyl(octanoyl) transferase